MNLFILPVVGFFIGIFVLSLGGGGGAIYVGILTALFHIPPDIAVTTSIATMIPTMIIGTISHYKQKNINFKIGKVMLISGVLGTVIGNLLSSIIPKELYTLITGALLIIIGLQLVVFIFRNNKEKKRLVRKVHSSQEYMDC